MADIYGDELDNVLEGTSEGDRIFGGGGDDTLYGFDWLDELYGEEGNDTLYGGNLSDWLYGGPGNDFLYGEDDADELHGGPGDDYLDGGGDTDFAYYTDADQAVFIDLAAGTALGEGTDTLVSIEGASGSQFDDVFIGNDGDNTFYGDYGNDYFFVSGGLDNFSGGVGNDTVDFSSLGSAVTIYSSYAIATEFSVGYNSIEVFIGTDYGDLINGGGGYNTYWGGAGDDEIHVGFYQDGDIAYGEEGNDLIYTGLGDDYIDGGDGFDIVYVVEGFYSWQDGPLLRGVTIDLSQAQQINPLYEQETQTDTLVNVEGAGGTAFADTLLGNGEANYLWGWYENGTEENHDTIRGQAGDDWIVVGEGNHNLAGNGGQDLLEFYGTSRDTSAGTGFTFSLALQGTEQDTGVGTMLAFGFEHLTGGFDDDHLTGDAGDNQLSGSGGNDVLLGGDGNDILRGDATTHMDETGWYLSLDGVVDNGANNDSLFGGNGDDWLDGEYGDDLLVGGSGMDMLVGGEGEDTLRGNGQKDDLDGGAARDKLYGGAGSDTAHGGEANDVVRGNGGDDNLFGDAGDDRILGGGGQDKIVGGEGNDELSGGNGADTFLFGIDSGTDVITDFTDGDTIEFAAGLGLAYEDLVIDDSLDGAVISWGSGDSILLSGVAAASLDAADFDFGADAMAATLSQIDVGLAG